MMLLETKTAYVLSFLFRGLIHSKTVNFNDFLQPFLLTGSVVLLLLFELFNNWIFQKRLFQTFISRVQDDNCQWVPQYQSFHSCFFLLFMSFLRIILFKNHLAHTEKAIEPQITAIAVKIYAITPFPNRWIKCNFSNTR